MSRTVSQFEQSRKIRERRSLIQVGGLCPNISLGLRQRLALRILGKTRASIDNNARDTDQQVFISKCNEHGLFADYQHGFFRNMRCPECEKNFLANWLAKRSRA